MKQCVVEGEASTKVKDIKIVISLKSRKVGKKKVYENKKKEDKSGTTNQLFKLMAESKLKDNKCFLKRK